ncbi:hypothetical protein KZ810_07880 [Sphingomonas sp. RHCKR47]|uniref:hypothetical protein n=1 Tax=Sphingomonas citricola TaxID=2862498 RepID=UPI001CA4F2EB|nr:hypothetical protein [Sphingomonas citricola]MBW6523415.1 hypothetical protein [Sphingomonas citricola]
MKPQEVSWAFTPEGLGWATWISDLVAVLALFAALGAFILEQRRANADRLRADQEAKRVRARFLHTCTWLASEAIRLIDEENDKVEFTNGFVWANRQYGITHVIEPIRDGAEGMQISAPAEGDLVLTLARTVRTLKDLSDLRGISEHVSEAEYRKFLSEKRADLQERLKQLTFLQTGRLPLPEELSIIPPAS